MTQAEDNGNKSANADKPSMTEDKTSDDGVTETKDSVNGIVDAFAEITDTIWDDIDTFSDDDDDEDYEDDADENEILYQFDHTKKSEDVNEEVYKSLSHWIENEMQLSTITKIEAATATMNLVFFNDEQCQKYRKIIRVVQEVLEQLSSGIRSKIDNHVCFEGDHGKTLLEKHLQMELRNVKDDQDNFFDPEKNEDEIIKLGKRLTNIGITRVIQLYLKDNDDIIQEETKLALDSITKMKQCFFKQVNNTFNNNRNEIENGVLGIDEIQKRLKNSCLKSFNKAFSFGERVNEVQGWAEKILRTDIEKEMQQMLPIKKQENDLDTDSKEDIPKVDEVEPASDKIQGQQQGKDMQPTTATTANQQNKTQQTEKEKPAPNPKPLKTNLVASSQTQPENNANGMKPLASPKLVGSLVSNNSSNHNPIQQGNKTSHSGTSPISKTAKKTPHNEDYRPSKAPNDQRKGKANSVESEQLESDLTKVYKFYLERMTTLVNGSNNTPIIKAAHDKSVLLSQQQPPYRNLGKSDKDLLQNRQDQHLQDLLKESRAQNANFHKQNPQRNVKSHSSATAAEPAIKIEQTTEHLRNSYANAKTKFLNDSPSDNNQNAAGLTKPKTEIIKSPNLPPPSSGNETCTVEDKAKRPLNDKTNALFQQRIILKAKCDDMDVMIKNQKFKVGSDALLKDAKNIVTHARHIASYSRVEEKVLREIDIIERTRENLLKAVVGSRY